MWDDRKIRRTSSKNSQNPAWNLRELFKNYQQKTIQIYLILVTKMKFAYG